MKIGSTRIRRCAAHLTTWSVREKSSAPCRVGCPRAHENDTRIVSTPPAAMRGNCAAWIASGAVEIELS